jgi:hypothetical protein
MTHEIQWEALSPHKELKGEPVSGTLAYDPLDVGIILKFWLHNTNEKILSKDAKPPGRADVLKRACRLAEHYQGIRIRVIHT